MLSKRNSTFEYLKSKKKREVRVGVLYYPENQRPPTS
jgi:hypothetical protein